MSPMSTPSASHVTLYTPTVWKDTATGYWIVRAIWAWKNCRTDWDNNKCWYTDDFCNYGASFTEQDRLASFDDDYTWDRGSIWYYFSLGSCTGMKGKAWEIDSKMSHTWSSTSVTGFSVSATGFGISWSGGTSKWSAVNPNPLYWYPCG